MTIDTDKYEGHTPGPWEAPHEILVSGLNHIGPLSNGQEEVNEVDAKLIADAPLLLAEVKRLREQQKKISEIAETNMALEWGDTDCGAEWGYIIDLIKGWTE